MNSEFDGSSWHATPVEVCRCNSWRDATSCRRNHRSGSNLWSTATSCRPPPRTATRDPSPRIAGQTADPAATRGATPQVAARSRTAAGDTRSDMGQPQSRDYTVLTPNRPTRRLMSVRAPAADCAAGTTAENRNTATRDTSPRVVGQTAHPAVTRGATPQVAARSRTAAADTRTNMSQPKSRDHTMLTPSRPPPRLMSVRAPAVDSGTSPPNPAADPRNHPAQQLVTHRHELQAKRQIRQQLAAPRHKLPPDLERRRATRAAT